MINLAVSSLHVVQCNDTSALLYSKIIKFVEINNDCIVGDNLVNIPEDIHNREFMIPVIYGNSAENVMESVYFDNSNGVRYLHIITTKAQKIRVKIFYFSL